MTVEEMYHAVRYRGGLTVLSRLETLRADQVAREMASMGTEQGTVPAGPPSCACETIPTTRRGP